MKRLLQFARRSQAALWATILAGFLAGLLTIWQAWLFSQTVVRVFLGGATYDQVRPLLAALAFAILMRALLAWGSQISAQAIASRIKNDLRALLLQHIDQLGPAYARNERSGSLSATLVHGIEALDAYYSQYLPQLALAALVPISILCFVFPLDWLSGLVLLITAPLIPLFMYLIGKAAERVTRKQYDLLTRLSAHLLDSLQGLTTLKRFGRSRAHIQTIASVSERYRDATLNVLRVTFLSALTLELLATLSTAIIAVEVGLRLLHARLTLEQGLFLLVIAPEFYIPLRMLGARFHAGMDGVSAARHIFAILDTPLPASPPTASPPPTPLAPLQFRDVHFTYPGQDHPALHNLSLTFAHGQHTALVGPSGAGKSTLFQLLLRFITPQKGEITANGVPLTDISVGQWRERIAWVPQMPYIFNDTIAANIRLARPQASQDEVEQAAKNAQLHHFIRGLPNGYQTQVGEQGARLSGGERQRLALARAFLKNADLLLLDEPTAHLDPHTEAMLSAAVDRLLAASGRTIITIAHRPGTVARADQVIALKNGQAHVISQPTTRPHPTPPPEATAPGFQPTAEATLPAEPAPAALSALQIVRRLLGFLHNAWCEVALSVLTGTLTIASNIALLGTSAWLISAAALHPSIAELQVAIVGVRFFGISRAIFRYLERLLSHGVTFRLLARLRIWFFRTLEPLAPARLQAYHSGDLLGRVRDDIETLQAFYVRALAPPLAAVLVGLGTTLALQHWLSAAVWLLPLGLMLAGVAIPFLVQKLATVPGQALIQKRAALNAHLIDHIHGLADLLAANQADAHRKQTLAQGEASERARQRLARLTGLQEATNLLFAHLTSLAVLALSIPLVTRGQLDGRLLAALSLMTLASFEAVFPLPQAAQTLSSSLEAAQRLFSLTEAQPAVTDPPDPRPLAPDRAGCAIRIQGLRFTYPAASQPALDDVHLALPAGKRLAIVGPSGAGKSTLPRLLLRFWEYESGEIWLNGHSIRDYDQEAVRRCFAVVPQTPHLFNATLRQNLLLADPQADDEKLMWALQQAQLDAFLRQLPAGLDTYIGAHGVHLSGGERQRVAIARALLKQAPILIFDEPTANLDPKTERALLNTLFAISAGRTTLWITHRLLDMERMDEILVFAHGKVAERGTHEALLARRGLYWQLYTLQQAYIR